MSAAQGYTPTLPARNSLVLMRAWLLRRGQLLASDDPNCYSQHRPGSYSRSVLEGTAGRGVTYSERRHRFAPGHQEKKNTLAADNGSSSIVSEVGVYAYAADLSLKA